MKMGYILRCTRCGSRSEPQNGTPPGPYTWRTCGVCLVCCRCEVIRVTDTDKSEKVTA